MEPVQFSARRRTYRKRKEGWYKPKGQMYALLALLVDRAARNMDTRFGDLRTMPDVPVNWHTMVTRLQEHGFVEVIRFAQRDIVIKVLRLPDGQEFIPPDIHQREAALEELAKISQSMGEYA